MSNTDQKNLLVVREYLTALQQGEVGEALARFFVEDAIQVEFPNKLNPNGQQSDLESIMSRSVQGQKVLSSQNYEILNELTQDDRVAVEAKWTGTLAIPLGTLEVGSKMRANFAMFFECRNGRILRQHNYDCFEPW